MEETFSSHSPLALKQAELFLSSLQDKGKSPNTLKNYKTDLDLFLNYLKEKDALEALASFNLTKVMEYGSYLDKRYTSDNSKRRRVQTLRLFFDYLVTTGLLTENPVRKLPTSPKFLDIPRPTPMNDIQKLWGHLCKEATQENPFEALLHKRNQISFLLIFGSGLKVSDLSQLQAKDLIVDDQPRVVIRPAKRDAYSVPLLEMFATVYKDYAHHLEAYKHQNNIQFDEVLFNANPYRILSGGISARGLEIIFEDLRKKLDLVLTPKSLRQACIFNWLHKKTGDTVLKEWMGVAPSYNLKLYKQHQGQHPYSDGFLMDVYLQEKGTSTLH